ncbi:MAG TPA: hypothetical protein PK299_11025 [Anaerolineales bacterium]|nr:hypothetical protein [Anaerolineales bacterium]
MSKNVIPLPIKLFSGFVALFGLLFAFTSYANPAQLSPMADMTNPATRLAFYTVGATVIGLSLGLFLAIFSNRPKSMALMLIVRTCVAVLDLLNALILGLGFGLALYQTIIILLGGASIFQLFRIIQSSEKKTL